MDGGRRGTVRVMFGQEDLYLMSMVECIEFHISDFYAPLVGEKEIENLNAKTYRRMSFTFITVISTEERNRKH
jgi:hypothetical protein